MSIPQIIAAAIAALNIITFFVYGIDKWKAKHGKWRTPEATLLILALVGGSLGAYAAMKVFHHKTQHKKFTILVPLFLILHIALIIYILFTKAF